MFFEEFFLISIIIIALIYTVISTLTRSFNDLVLPFKIVKVNYPTNRREFRVYRNIKYLRFKRKTIKIPYFKLLVTNNLELRLRYKIFKRIK